MTNPSSARTDSEVLDTPSEPIRPSLVVDQASLTYQIRSATPSEKDTKKGVFSRLRGVSGVEANSVKALHPLSFVVENGEAVGVIGTNGSGKSTLMKLLTGQMGPTSGSIYAASTPIMLGVKAALVPTISGDENITLGCLAMGMTHAQVQQKRDAIIDLSGLRGSLHLPMKSYSSGMASRLQFAIATSVDPEILIIDEALNTGDAQFKARTKQRLDQLREQAGCVFLVSHSLSTIKQMCSRVIWLEQGDLTMDGDPQVVTKQYTQYAKLLAGKEPEAAQALLSKIRAQTPKTKIRW